MFMRTIIAVLAVGGWLNAMSWQQMMRTAGSEQVRLHAIYCQCEHCPDVQSCCCMPSSGAYKGEQMSQCNPTGKAAALNTWNARIVSPTIYIVCMVSESY